jgi:hypothetical protein
VSELSHVINPAVIEPRYGAAARTETFADRP